MHQSFHRPEAMAALKAKIDNKEVKVGVLGFGYIGTCIGAVIAEQGYDVVGIDVRKTHVDEINSGTTTIAEPGLPELVNKVVKSGKLRATTDVAPLRDCDVVVVTVGTPLGENFDPDTRDIIAAAQSVAKNMKPGQLIILKSTVPPRTTEDVFMKPLLAEHDADEFYLAFCPERLAEGRAIIEFKTIPVVIGGVHKACSEMAEHFWRKVLNIKTIVVENSVSAELVKLADNLWIDLNVALANELALLCEKYGVDALPMIAATNSLPKGTGNVNVLFPSLGVGGYCLTKDPWFVHHIGKQFGLDLLTPVASRTANDRMPEHTFGLIRDTLKKSGRDLKNSRVAVLGISFKNNTGDCRYTPTKPILDLLESSGCDLEICDPWVHEKEAVGVTKRKLNPDMHAALKGADCAAFFTGHDQFKNISISTLKELLKPGAVIIDGRNFFSAEQIRQAKAAGFYYQGVGRA